MKQQLLKHFACLFLLLLCTSGTTIPKESSTTNAPSSSSVFIRIFKHEKTLEVWEQKQRNGKFVKTKTFAVCAASGKLGPKRQQGDRQVPEGFYKIDLFNPNSQYHLSMRVDYPNVSDKIRTTNPRKPGGQIMIHGGCASIGCVSIGDENIEELYALMERQKRNGQKVLPVHIFPCRMNALRYNILTHLQQNNTPLLQFWKELESGYLFFEKNRRVPNVQVGTKGQYLLTSNQPLL